MEKITVYFLLMLIISEAFFIRSRDIRRMLQYFPGFGDGHTHHRPPVRHHHHRRYHENIPEAIHHRDEYNNHEHYNRNDGYYSKENEESNNRYSNRNSKQDYYQKPTHNNDRKSHHYPGDGCDENHHERNYQHRGPHKFPEDRYENSNKNKYDENEESDDYYEQKAKYSPHNKQKNYHYQKKYQNKKTTPVDEQPSPEDTNYYDRNSEDKPHGHLNYKKDYVTGVLVTIPKINSNDDLQHYFREARPQNSFFHNLLKTEDNHHHQHPHHVSEGNVIKSYLYK